jgi:hypothetical protein
MKALKTYYVMVDYDNEDPSTYKGVVLTHGKTEVLRINTGDFKADLATMDTKYPAITRGSQVKTHDSVGRYAIDSGYESDVDRMSEFQLKFELLMFRKKHNHMVKFIRDHKLVEEYNLTTMLSRLDSRELSIPIGQHEIDTMKELVQQYGEVKSRLTALYEMGDNETGGELQELYDQTGLEY